MPIKRLLKDSEHSAEQVERLNIAFNLALRTLNLVDRNDPLCEMVARKIIDLGTEGMNDPREIAERAVKEVGL